MPAYNDDPNFGIEQPGLIDMLMAQINKSGKSDYAGGIHAMSVRMPTFLFATVEALCKHSGMSRNKLICQALEVGMEHVFSELTPEDYEAISRLRYDTIVELARTSSVEQAKVGEC